MVDVHLDPRAALDVKPGQPLNCSTAEPDATHEGLAVQRAASAGSPGKATIDDAESTSRADAQSSVSRPPQVRTKTKGVFPTNCQCLTLLAMGYQLKAGNAQIIAAIVSDQGRINQ